MSKINIEQTYKVGDIVYIIIRNPHAQDVAQVQQAAIVKHPEQPGKLALFSYDHFYLLTNELAVFSTEEAAEMVYHEAFGTVDGEYYD